VLVSRLLFPKAKSTELEVVKVEPAAANEQREIAKAA
jgi:hypothetical protein